MKSFARQFQLTLVFVMLMLVTFIDFASKVLSVVADGALSLIVFSVVYFALKPR